MTNHYTLQLVKSGMKLKATYKNKRFLRIEYISGSYDIAVINHLGVIIPVYEKEFEKFEKAFQLRVAYSEIIKEKSLFTQFNESWFTFYESYKGIAPKFTGADGAHLKQIISYLKQVSTNEKEALEAWKTILFKWKTLDEFHLKNTDLKYINSRLNVIINAIKENNGTSSTGSGHSVNL